MSSLAQAKTLGGIGSILIILSVVPSAGPLLAIIGLVLVLVAVKYISDAVGDRSIFNNMIVAVVLAIVGLAVGAFLLFASLFSIIGLSGFTQPGPSFNGADFAALFVTLALALVIIWAFFLASSIFYRRSFNTIASRLNVRMFGTAALLYLIGAALTVVLVGLVLVLVAGILQIIAFFSIPEQIPSPTQPSTTAPV